MPVQGLVRLRKHQFGRQQLVGTKVAATRAYPAQGTPSVDLTWEDPELDTGSIDPTAPPERGVPEITADLTYPALTYNDATKIMCGFFGGNVSPSTVATTGRIWTHDPSSTTVDELDRFTYEFGDDVTTDWYQLGDGVVESFEITGPEGLGALSATATWRFGSASSKSSTDSPVDGTVPTPGLAVSTTDIKLYLKDGGIAIASTVAGLGAGQITDALHTFTLRGSGDIDEKRWANGGPGTFDADEMVRATRQIELECTFSKTDDTVGTGSETDAWFSDDAVNRYVRLTFTASTNVGTATPYSWVVTMPMRYYTREEGESDGNTVIVLTGRAFYDPVDFTGVFTSVLTNTLTEAQLGLAGS